MNSGNGNGGGALILLILAGLLLILGIAAPISPLYQLAKKVLTVVLIVGAILLGGIAAIIVISVRSYREDEKQRMQAKEAQKQPPEEAPQTTDASGLPDPDHRDGKD